MSVRASEIPITQATLVLYIHILPIWNQDDPGIETQPLIYCLNIQDWDMFPDEEET